MVTPDRPLCGCTVPQLCVSESPTGGKDTPWQRVAVNFRGSGVHLEPVALPEPPETHGSLYVQATSAVTGRKTGCAVRVCKQEACG